MSEIAYDRLTVEKGPRRINQEDAIRRSFDLVLSAAALILLSVPILILAILIRIDSPGPAIFKQARLGKNCKPFVFYKFRTMYSDAATRFPHLYDYAALSNEPDFLFKRPEDPRLTRIGRWLRRTGLDELPNLINVVKGDCSLVGPRPDIPEMLPQYTATQRARFAVRPGITSLAHIKGGNKLTFAQTAFLDAEYVANRSWTLDAKILLLTARTIIRGDLH
ncbi:MAG: sugar transferase [Acetobacteraceae bacterium]|nr:sugar transferase [Acetobacteraceae bacterium]